MITIIVAMTRDGIIGKNNRLPWHIPDDLKNFKNITLGNTVIMGKNTFLSIGKPLSGRHNIVLSEVEIGVQGIDVCSSIKSALKKAHFYEKEIFVIGGAHVYEQFIPLADRLLISHIKEQYDGDVAFPQCDMTQWKQTQCVDYPDFEFVAYVRLDPNKAKKWRYL